MSKLSQRQKNSHVEQAKNLVLKQIDLFIGGQSVVLPPPAICHVADNALRKAASVRLASMFLAAYAVADPTWDCDALPVGYRGERGDKGLARGLTLRHITLHDAITAFGENLGWKGNVRVVRLSTDPKFREFTAMLQEADAATRAAVVDYLASRFAESRQEMKALPPVGPEVLTFARAKLLLSALLGLQTSGHVQQFVVAAMIAVHRERHQIVVTTHHPHAADKFDDTAGDVEEHFEGRLIRAYEVTVRPDWKSRLTVLRAKMDRAGLSKYVIIASQVNSDQQLARPANLVAFMSEYERDIAVVDIQYFANVFAAELTATELRKAVNLAYDYLCQPHLCGRAAYQDAYRQVVDDWLDRQ